MTRRVIGLGANALTPTFDGNAQVGSFDSGTGGTRPPGPIYTIGGCSTPTGAPPQGPASVIGSLSALALLGSLGAAARHRKS